MDWLIFALLSAIFAGLVAIFGKVGVRDVDSTLATMVRSIIMALTLISIVLVKTINKSESILKICTPCPREPGFSSRSPEFPARFHGCFIFAPCSSATLRKSRPLTA